MSRSSIFRKVSRAMRIAHFADRHGYSTQEALDRVAHDSGRRKFLGQSGKWLATGVAASMLGSWRSAFAAPTSTQASIGIVGAGLAGLSCAAELKGAGILASVYEATTDRIGGRCFSLSNFFPGQVAERGGELIDTLHKGMLGYANEMNLAVEDVNKDAGDCFYYFDGVLYPEAQFIDEYRAFVAAMHADLRALSGALDATSFTAEDRRIDLINLDDYLRGKNGLNLPAGPLCYRVLKACYEAEYGLLISQQSCLNFLQFIHADKRAKFAPWGVFSDERYHIVGGNDQIAKGLAARIDGQIEQGLLLTAVRRTSGGRIELTFQSGSRSVTRVHDRVVLALPFTVLRNVNLDASLALPDWKMNAIAQMGYGTNAKMMLGFDGRPWVNLGGSGASYSNLANHQCTWETNRANSSALRGLLTDYSSGPRGAGLNPKQVQTEAERFLTDLDKVMPGAKAMASRTKAGYRVHLEHWPSNPLSLGSYTCYRPGQFTSIAGLEKLPVANLHFAGEHTDSFYNFQGFMEGAVQSGLRAAAELLKILR